MKRVFYVVSVLFLFCHCSQRSNVEDFLKDSKILLFFEEENIRELNSLIAFFEAELSNKGDFKNLSAAYQSLNMELYKAPSVNDQIKTNFIKQEELEKVIKGLTTDLFSDLWIYEYGYDWQTKDTLSITLNINSEGCYMELLRALSAESEEFYVYTKEIDAGFGYIGPSCNGYFPTLGLSLDFEKPVNRLVFMVHYITLVYYEDYLPHKSFNQTM